MDRTEPEKLQQKGSPYVSPQYAINIKPSMICVSVCFLHNKG